jgi:PhzF family phenazine biosynthesis protein
MGECVQNLSMRIFQVDAFTETAFAGNPASVVLGADGAPEDTLRAIAREYPHAETAFVFAPLGADHEVALRFFNARKEAPFVGHATIAAHAVLRSLGLRPPGIVRQHSGTGVIEVGERGAMFEFRQSLPEFGAPLNAALASRVAAALALPTTRLDSDLRPVIARKGSTRLLLPLADAADLDAMAPDSEALLDLGRELGAEGFFAFAVRRDGAALSTDARMFCPALGILEDPVSGNAHAMLAAYLFAAGRIDARSSGFVGRQGRQMGRPGRVEVSLDCDAAALASVRIGGRAVLISSGQLL